VLVGEEPQMDRARASLGHFHRGPPGSSAEAAEHQAPARKASLSLEAGF